ncbi:TetR/AcrR family transcriptional regulator [Streptomyces sp. NPDC058855]|uniref:TetR/AcrR family transcriptional regulator n=1 Tax=Streptomyces sp. NPDC058855 TaxID=3346651 RepID=UPI0036A28E1C
MENRPGTRDRIVIAAASLLRRQGYVGTAVKQIAREAGATLGSVYHFFPGGKEALATAAIKHGEGEFAALLRTALDSEEQPGAAVAACARELAENLRRTSWAEGCPITAAALETLGTHSGIQQACVAALRTWERLVAERLLRSGFAPADARHLATTIIGTLEGAEVASQVRRSEDPLRTAGRHLARLVDSYRA